MNASKNSLEKAPNQTDRAGGVRTREAVAVLLFALGFLTLLLLTMGRLSRPWWDEVQGAEVAVNMIRGDGFTSAASLAQTRHEFYAGNGPLFHLLMAGWLRLFGFSAEAVRSLNYVLITLAAVGVWAAAARSRLLQWPLDRFLLVAMLLCGLSMGRVYLNNRYDGPGVLVIVLLLLGMTFQPAGWRFLWLAVCGFVCPFFGMHLAPYTGILCILAIWIDGRRVWKEVAVVLASVAMGLVGLFLFWYLHGALESVVRAASFDVTPLQNRWLRLLHVVRDALLIYQINDTTLLAAAMALCVLSPSVRRRLHLRSPLVVGLACAAAIPMAMTLAGRYSGVYAWMALLPVAGCALAARERELSASTACRWLIPATAIVVCLVGVPAKIVLSAMEWNARDHNRLDAFVSQYVRPDDHAYCTFTAYYPLKRQVRDLWVGCGWAKMAPEDRESLTLLVLEPAKPGQCLLPEGPSSQEALASLGGNWRMVGEYVTHRSSLTAMLWPRYGSGARLDEEIFHLQVYRRALSGLPRNAQDH